jgi:heme exporter protein C
MFQPLLVMILGFYCFYAVALILSVRVEILARERKTSWVRERVKQAAQNSLGATL